MIVEWMIYLLLISALLGGAALAGERVFPRLGLGSRWPWLAALVLTPLLSIARRLLPQTDGEGAVGFTLGRFEALGGVATGGLVPGSTAMADLTPYLLAGWFVLSALVAFRFAASYWVLGRLRRQWTSAQLDGFHVLVAKESGPAVVGCLPGRIVVPEWTRELDPTELRLLLTHEAEHIRAGDPLTMLAGIVVAVCLPWNPLAWWQLSRLRHAVEIDCDRRVLGRVGRVTTYGELLLRVFERSSRLPAAAAAFATHPSQLERRVRAMTRKTHRTSPVITAAIALVAIGLVFVACQVDQPTSLAPTTNSPVPSPTAESELALEPTFTPFTVRPELVDRRGYASRLMELYPSELRENGVGGQVLMWVFIQADGSVGNVQVVESSGHAGLDTAGATAMREASFTPARFEDDPVAVWIQIPVTFAPTPPPAGD